MGKVKLFFLVKTALHVSHTKECMSSSNLFLIVGIFFVTDLKEMKLAQTA